LPRKFYSIELRGGSGGTAPALFTDTSNGTLTLAGDSDGSGGKVKVMEDLEVTEDITADSIDLKDIHSHIDFFETDAENKQWRVEGSAYNFQITEVGIDSPIKINDTSSGAIEMTRDLEVDGGISSGSILLDEETRKVFFMKNEHKAGQLNKLQNVIKTGLKGIVNVSLNLAYERNGSTRYKKIANNGTVEVEYDKEGNIYVDISKSHQYRNASYHMLIQYGEWKIKRNQINDNEETENNEEE